jgi:hypothetical protein
MTRGKEQGADSNGAEGSQKTKPVAELELTGDEFGIKCYRAITSAISILQSLPEYRAAEVVEIPEEGINFKKYSNERRFKKNGKDVYVSFEQTFFDMDCPEMSQTAVNLLVLYDETITRLHVAFRRNLNVSIYPPYPPTEFMKEDSLGPSKEAEAFDDQVSFSLGPLFSNRLNILYSSVNHNQINKASISQKEDEALTKFSSTIEELALSPVTLSKATLEYVHEHFWRIARDEWDRPNSPEYKEALKIMTIFGEKLNSPINVPLTKKEDIKIVFKYLEWLLSGYADQKIDRWQFGLPPEDQSESAKFYKSLGDDWSALAIELGEDKTHTPTDLINLGMFDLLSDAQLQELSDPVHETGHFREQQAYRRAKYCLKEIEKQKAAKK